MPTYSPAQAIDFCRILTKNTNIETIQVRVLDGVNKMMWMAAPWRWTVGSFAAPLVVLANTQDYTVNIPARFIYALNGELIDTTGAAPRDLEVVPYLPIGGAQIGQPSKFALIAPVPGGTGTLRLYPKPGTISPTNQLLISHKRSAPTLTATNLNTAGVLEFDDEWSPTYESGVLWLSYLYSDDARAGTANYSGEGRWQFTGQRAIFEANLQLMREREKLPLFSYRSVPDAKLDK